MSKFVIAVSFFLAGLVWGWILGYQPRKTEQARKVEKMS